MNFSALLSATRGEIDARLEALFAEEEAMAARYGDDTVAVCRAVRDLTMRGGKRARPALVVAGYLATPGADPKRLGAAHDVGVALELLQTYLLIHDDWMDGDVTRRGGPAVHVLMERHYGSGRMGEVGAILAGDFACALSQRALGSALRASSGVPVLSTFARIQRDVVFGQILDVGGKADDVEAMHELKTGSYTVSGPLELGALLAGASEAVMASLLAYASPLGVAFQLCDDLLSAFGTEAATGKPRGNDLRAGKRTAVVVEAERLMSPADRAAFTAVYGRAQAPEDKVEEAIEALERCGARAAVEARRDALVQRSLEALDQSTLAERELLRGAAVMLAVRSA